MPSYLGLYYPFIHFRGGDDWVKLSALHWDEMHRIVPESDQPFVSSLEEALSRRGGIKLDGFERGFIQNYHPVAEAARVGQVFADFLDDNKRRLKRAYSVKLQDRWQILPHEWLDSRDDPSVSPKLARIFYGKLPDRLREKLLSTELAEDWPDGREVWMHPRLAAVWMTLLAEEISSRRGLEPVTEHMLSHLAVNGCTPERLGAVLLGNSATPASGSQGEKEGHVATLMMKAYAPRALADMDTDSVLEFREANRTLLLAYRKWLGSLIKDWSWLDGINDPEVVQERLQERYEAELKPILEDAERRARRQWAITAGSALAVSVTIPTGVNLIAKLVGVDAEPISAATAGVALGIHKVLVDDQKAATDRAKENGAYLLQLRRWRRPSALVAATKKMTKRLS